jgi:hypothetical protein
VTYLTRPDLPSTHPPRQRASAVAAASLSRAATWALTPLRLAQARTAVGVGMLARPTLLPQVLGVDRPASTQTAWAVQMLGAREVALGAGTWLALRRGDDRAARLWLAAGLLADAADALVVAAATVRGRVPVPGGAAVVSVATTAAAVQAAALAESGSPLPSFYRR